MRISIQFRARLALSLLCLMLLCILLICPNSTALAAAGNADFAPWPRTVKAGDISAEIYQPQIDAWDGTGLKARAAVAATVKGAKEPVYGVLSMEATLLVDKPTRTARLDQIKNLNSSFPSDPALEKRFVPDMRDALLKATEYISLDRLEAALAITEAKKSGAVGGVKNTPPRIYFSNTPALLVTIDGNPKYAKLPNTSLERVLNTRVLLLRDDNGMFFIHFLNGYLQSAKLEGPWSIAKIPPKDAKAAEKFAADYKQIDLMSGQPDPKSGKKPTLAGLPATPMVYVSTTPAELIEFQGEPQYATLGDTGLLYVSNTTGNVFKYTKDNKSYVLLAGRWFSAASLNGPWSYVPPKSLPKAFAAIPDDSAKENVKASVPGTVQAKEAATANQIPQTATVDRAKTSYTASYDGPVKLEDISGTSLQYVLNSPDPVIKVDASHWYALHNGVWFSAASYGGPWSVATDVPAAIYGIPVSSPLHYVVYVRIYSVTPASVVIGYTPGYYGAILTPDGVVVYGTGYVYPSYVGGIVWYGAPVTYGVGASMCWTPWSSWAFAYGLGWGWGYAGCACGWWYPPAPWWGPYYAGAYYNGYGGVTAWGPGGWAGTTGNIYQHWGNVESASRGAGGFDAYTGNRFAGQYGTAYNSSTGAMAVGHSGAVQNVYTGNYAYGSRAAGVNSNTGAAVSGGRVTVGNDGAGNAATANHVDVRTASGQHVDAGGVRTNDGAIGHVNDNVFAGKDGQAYHYNKDTGNWDQINAQAGKNAQTSQKAGAGTRPEANAKAMPNARPEAAQRPEPQAGGKAAGSVSGGQFGERQPAQGRAMAQNRPNQPHMSQEFQARNMGAARENAFRQHGAGMGHAGGFGHIGGAGAFRRR